MVNSENDLMNWQRQWANFHVLLAMAQLGLFDLLSDMQPRSAETIAEQLGADARAVDICGRILVRAGLLTFSDEQFQLSTVAKELPLNDLKWEWRRRNNFANLIDTIRTGRPAMVTSGGVVEEDENDAREFLRMLHRQSEAGVNEAVKVLNTVWSRQRTEPDQKPRILDLGGGHGRYAATFAQSIEGARVTLFDREVATRIALELSGTGFDVRSGDFLCDDLGGPYEIVFMASIVSGIAIEDVRALFKRLREVIVPGGTVVIQDMFIKEDCLDPAAAIDFNLILLLENERGRFRTVPELVQLLAEAGFPQHEHFPVEGQDFSFLVGW